MQAFSPFASGLGSVGGDVDLLVRLPDSADLLDVAGLALALEEILQVKVDVVPEGSLTPDALAAVERDAIPL